jgi:hypothetical protein
MGRDFAKEVVDFGLDVKDEIMASNGWTPDKLLEGGAITEAQYAGAVRYLEDYQQGVDGAGKIIRPGHKVPGVGQIRTKRQAAESYRDAFHAVGSDVTGALNWCVLGRGTVSGLAECKGWNPQRALTEVIKGLDKLAAHYGSA